MSPTEAKDPLAKAIGSIHTGKVRSALDDLKNLESMP